MDSLLRDVNREQQKMQADVENLQRHYEKLVAFVHQYIQQTTVEWAKLVINHPETLLLLVETTSIVDENGHSYGESEPIRFTAYHFATETVILDQPVRPTHSHDIHGSEYHGLTMSDVANKPRLAEIWPGIQETIADHHIVIFGADFARSALQSVYHTHVLDSAYCLHNRVKEYYNEFYNFSLEKVLEYQGIDKKRDDLKDSQERALMLAAVLRNLAAGMIKQVRESESTAESFLDDDGLGDLDAHPF